ncbi:PREDICTED: coiled-coil domain-containing protein 18 isoform X3 [Populus euphratica]|uniref:Coiled-coil domain-containing protein 18 isoform X3 n=1 Tax=Populus euphratica TaxID=75702 RepID=A0AAJ6X6N4_POPEU|nr:PREDICTED: coiled-coil domain-containing protein 18 isoform X3 [Populus euphratica]
MQTPSSFTPGASSRSLQSLRLTAKRLEDVSVSCRGEERVQLLRRWLVALKETDRERMFSSSPTHEHHADDSFKDSPKKPTIVYYVDPDLGTMDFREVFLYSQALEGITLSMILEAPNEEEVSLLLEIFGLCLAGGKEVHEAVMNSIQDLATAFTTYEDEVLEIAAYSMDFFSKVIMIRVKREELLQYAQSAISGLKINADIARIDAEAHNIMEKLEKSKALNQLSNEASGNSSEETTALTMEAVEEKLGQIQLCSTLEALLLKKKSLRNGDSPEMHVEKVDKLKILSESLLNSTSKAEKRILEQRTQKEDALNFRVAKGDEISQLEKELSVEIREMEKQKDELEAELKKVNTSLNSARARIHNAREERENFDEASNQILMHLKAKEDELAKSVTSCRAEADVVNSWINFLYATWVLQTTDTEQRENQVNGDLERYGDHFVNLSVHLLSAYKEQLGPLVIRMKGLVADLHSCQGSEIAPIIKDEGSKAINHRKNLEKGFLELEAKIVTITNAVHVMKKQFYTNYDGVYRKNDERVKELFSAVEKMKEGIESIQRPVLEVENATQQSHSQSSDSPRLDPSSSSKQTFEAPGKKEEKESGSPPVNRGSVVTQADLEKLGSELGKDEEGYATEDIGEWEFDELEKEVNPKQLTSKE